MTEEFIVSEPVPTMERPNNFSYLDYFHLHVLQVESNYRERRPSFVYCTTSNLRQKGQETFNLIRTGGGGGGGVFHQAQGFLPITLEVIKVHSRNLVTFP